MDAKTEDALTKIIKITLNWVVGPILFLWLGYSVHRQVVSQPDFKAHLQRLGEAAAGPQSWMLAAVALLVFCNWALETLKWQVLMRRLHPMGFFPAFRAVLTGVAFSLGTPNRIGDFGGRMLHLPEGKRGRSVTLSAYAAFSQLLVTLLMGLAGILLLNDRLSLAEGAWVDLLLWASVASLILCLPVFVRPGQFARLFKRLPAWTRLAHYTSALSGLGRGEKTEVFLLSLLRFCVFGLQYCLMLAYLGAGIGWWEGFWAVAVFYLAMTLVPSVALLELGLRWQFGLLVFGLFTRNLLAVYVASTGIWLFNLVLPGLVGGILSLNVRLFRQASRD